MSGVHRLPSDASPKFGREIDRSEPVGWRYDGRAVAGLYGDTVASALLASGRAVLTRSPLLGRPRGVMTLGADDPHLWAAPEGEEEPLPANEIAIAEGFFARSAGSSSTYLSAAGLTSIIGSRSASFGPDSRLLPASHRMLERLRRNLPLPQPAVRAAAAARMTATRESCDVLVVGAGLAGLAAATAARAAGLRALVVEATSRPGGLADLYDGQIDGRPFKAWVDDRVGALRDRDPEAVALRSVAIGIDPDGVVSVLERKPGPRPGPTRLRLIEPRAIVLATGWRERPLLFADNDRPGVVLAGAARALLRRYAVAPGDRVVVATTSDEGYRTAIDLKEAGVAVEMIVDAREDPQGPAVDFAKALGATVSFSSMVAGLDCAERGERIVGVGVENRFGEGAITGARSLFADALVVSGGLVARDELARRSGLGEDRGVFAVAGGPNANEALAGGTAAGLAAAAYLGAAAEVAAPQADATVDPPEDGDGLEAYLARLKPEGAASAFVDFGADVTLADLADASARGIVGPAALVRWLGLGRGPDGGHAGADLVAQALAAGGLEPQPPRRATLAVMAARAGLADR